MSGTMNAASQKKVTQFTLRPYRRIPTRYVVHYMSGAFLGKGMMTNLSQSGMRVQGDHIVTPGLDVSVRMILAENGASVQIERATVRWVNGYDFGLEFRHVAPVAAKEITHMITTRIHASSLPSHHD